MWWQELLLKWYQSDTNAVPACWRLRSTDSTDHEWIKVEQELSAVVFEASGPLQGLSITHQELNEAVRFGNEGVFAFVRSIKVSASKVFFKRMESI